MAKQTASVKAANTRLAATANALRTKILEAERKGPKQAAVKKDGRDLRTRTNKKITHSYRLFSLLKKQKGTATTEQLAAATGLPPGYVAWYMAELKRVYGVKLQHKRGDSIWKATNTSAVVVPPGGIAGQRRNQEDVAKVVQGLKAGLDTLVTVLNRSSITESRANS